MSRQKTWQNLKNHRFSHIVKTLSSRYGISCSRRNCDYSRLNYDSLVVDEVLEKRNFVSSETPQVSAIGPELSLQGLDALRVIFRNERYHASTRGQTALRSAQYYIHRLVERSRHVLHNNRPVQKFFESMVRLECRFILEICRLHVLT